MEAVFDKLAQKISLQLCEMWSAYQIEQKGE